MKNIKRYLVSIASLGGLALCWLPLTGKGDTAYTAVQLISYWKKFDPALAIWLCLVIAVIAATVVLNCFGEKKVTFWMSAIMSSVGGISMLILIWLGAGKHFQPGIGGIGVVICLLLACILSCMEAYSLKSVCDAGILRKDERENDISTPGTANKEQYQQEILCQKNVQEFPKGSLYIGCGLLKGERILLEHMETVAIGRDVSVCNLIVEEAAVSRKHCTVTYNGLKNTYLLLDTSSNGTYLAGGQRLPKNFAMEIQSGMRFYIGNLENSFQLGEKHR